MKKHLFFFIIAMSLLVMSSHVRGQGVDLRSVVAVVRVNNCESSKTFLKEYGAMLRKDGYTEGADWIESYIEGGFGSGFTYQDPVTKKFYIITNRHVVAFSENVTVEFVEKDKSVVKYEQCPVVAIHDEMDIAIVALPDSVQRSSLLFSQQVLKEGVDVFTAGYPGLGGYPSWQFGMGIISNARFYSPIFADYKDIPLIQHTAQADAGSSGGPLLVKSPESQNSYLVVGINTWKIHAIENANFSIPAQHAMDLIHELTNTTVELSDEQLLARANQFVSALDDYKKITPFISFEYLSEIKPRDFYDWYNASPKDVKEEIAKMFNESPIDAVRTALAYAIHSKVVGKSLKVVDVDGHTVNMLYDNKAVTSQWVKEQGKLRVKTFSFFNPKTDAKSGIIKNFGGKNFISFGVSRGFATDPNLMFNFSYGFKLRHFFNFELMFRYGTLPINLRTDENSVFTNLERVTGFEWFLGVQLPIRVGVTYLIPYVKPFWGMGLRKIDILFSYGVRSGLETGFRMNNRKYLVLGVGYKMSRFSYIESGGKTLLPTHSLDLYLKLYFSRK